MDAFANELRRCRDELGGSETERTLVRGTPVAAGPPPMRPARARRPGGHLPVLLALAGVVLLAIVVAALLYGGGSIGRRHHNGGGTVNAVTLHGVGNYDPKGNPDSHADTAKAATDGNTGTDWYTQIYATPDFGNLKSGLGLVVDAGRSTKLRTLRVQTPTPGFVAQIRAGGSLNGPFADDSAAQTVSSSTTFTLSGKTAEYYVVWISRLPGGGKAEISEVTAR
jgi:hypothetical protein